MEAAENLNKDGYEVRVVSMPCLEEFLSQSRSYQNKVIPKNIDNILLTLANEEGEKWMQILAGHLLKVQKEIFYLFYS